MRTLTVELVNDKAIDLLKDLEALEIIRLIDLDRTDSSDVRVDKSLNRCKDVVLFPEKVEKARLAFEKFGLPDLEKGC